MKRLDLALLIILLSLPNFCFSQEEVKEILYKIEQVANWAADCEGDPACIEESKDIPNNFIHYAILQFNDTCSNYSLSDSIDISTQIKIKEIGEDYFDTWQYDAQVFFSGSRNISYTKFNFIDTFIEDSLNIRDAKFSITKNRKKVLDYTCMNAQVDLGDMGVLDVWFTPELPYDYGPWLACNYVPGVILELHQTHPMGKVIYRAVDIQTKPNIDITYPVDEYMTMQEFNEEYGGDND